MGKIALSMFFRWNQENYFKYIIEEENLNHLVSRGFRTGRYRTDDSQSQEKSAGKRVFKTIEATKKEERTLCSKSPKQQ